MKILVTGASGLIGRHTVEALLAAGHRVRTFQRGELPPGVGVEHVWGDVTEGVEPLCAAIRGCEAVVHLAGRGDVGESRREPLASARLNSLGALHALEAARVAGAHLVLASSQRVYPPQPRPCREADPPAPDSPYGFAKWTAELWCRMATEQYGLPTTILRFFSVYGPGQQPNGLSGVVAIFARAALDGQPLVVRSAGQRDFTDARDVARGIVCALERPATPATGHRLYNLATGVGTTFRGLAEAVVEVAGTQAPIHEALDEPAGRDLVADVSRAQADLGYTARVPLREGLRHYVRWLRTAT